MIHLLTLGGIVLVAALAVLLGFTLAARAAHRFGQPILLAAIRHGRMPTTVLAVAVAALAGEPLLHLQARTDATVTHVLSLVLIASIGWTVVTALEAGEDAIVSRLDGALDAGHADPFRARRVHTQTTVLRRVSVVVVIGLTVAGMLTTFEKVRALGTSLLASAGIIGLVAGIAARPILSNVLAGMQIAVSEPIRIGDVLVVDGHWGRVEEISLTYVVFRIWDDRRLVLPISYFITNPFESWTRRSTDLLGVVYLYADYTVDVEAVRAELNRVLTGTDLWDGRVARVQVTSAEQAVVQLRALVSAADSSQMWDLRCLVRERLVTFLAGQAADTLPRLRTQPSAHAPTAPTEPSRG